MPRAKKTESYSVAFHQLRYMIMKDCGPEYKIRLADERAALSFRFSWYAYLNAIEREAKHLPIDHPEKGDIKTLRTYMARVEGSTFVLKDRNDDPLVRDIMRQLEAQALPRQRGVSPGSGDAEAEGEATKRPTTVDFIEQFMRGGAPQAATAQVTIAAQPRPPQETDAAPAPQGPFGKAPKAPLRTLGGIPLEIESPGGKAE